jgi:hypothetical protein
MPTTSSIIRNYLNIFLKRGKQGFLLKEQRPFSINKRDSITLFPGTLKKITRRRFSKNWKRKHKLCMKNIGRHITMTLSLGSSTMLRKKKNINRKDRKRKDSMGKTLIIFCLHPMSIGSLSSLITQNLSPIPCRSSMRRTITQRSDSRRNT